MTHQESQFQHGRLVILWDIPTFEICEKNDPSETSDVCERSEPGETGRPGQTSEPGGTSVNQ